MYKVEADVLLKIVKGIKMLEEAKSVLAINKATNYLTAQRKTIELNYDLTGMKL